MSPHPTQFPLMIRQTDDSRQRNSEMDTMVTKIKETAKKGNTFQHLVVTNNALVVLQICHFLLSPRQKACFCTL